MDARTVINNIEQKDEKLSILHKVVLIVNSILPVIGFLIIIRKLYSKEELAVSVRRGYCIGLVVQVVIMICLAIISVKYTLW